MRDPTRVSAPDVKAITVFLASTATPERGGLVYLELNLPPSLRGVRLCLHGGPRLRGAFSNRRRSELEAIMSL